jgi:hypothetical protein
MDVPYETREYYPNIQRKKKKKKVLGISSLEGHQDDGY